MSENFNKMTKVPLLTAMLWFCILIFNNSK